MEVRLTVLENLDEEPEMKEKRIDADDVSIGVTDEVLRILIVKDAEASNLPEEGKVRPDRRDRGKKTVS
jgi:hypothetical protein